MTWIIWINSTKNREKRLCILKGRFLFWREDVYKRQPPYGGGAGQPHPEYHAAQDAWHGNTKKSRNKALIIIAVSYTHLDVYKRQL